MDKMLEDEFTELFLERFSGEGDVISFAKGRVALYAGLKASKIPEGSEILVPAWRRLGRRVRVSWSSWSKSRTTASSAVSRISGLC